jgi:hypothetical protein
MSLGACARRSAGRGPSHRRIRKERLSKTRHHTKRKPRPRKRAGLYRMWISELHRRAVRHALRRPSRAPEHEHCYPVAKYRKAGAPLRRNGRTISDVRQTTSTDIPRPCQTLAPSAVPQHCDRDRRRGFARGILDARPCARTPAGGGLPGQAPGPADVFELRSLPGAVLMRSRRGNDQSERVVPALRPEELSSIARARD